MNKTNSYSMLQQDINLGEYIKDSIPFPEVLSEPEAARVLGISSLTLRRARKRGEISFLQIGRRILYSSDHINQYLAFVERRKSKHQIDNAKEGSLQT